MHRGQLCMGTNLHNINSDEELLKTINTMIRLHHIVHETCGIYNSPVPEGCSVCVACTRSFSSDHS